MWWWRPTRGCGCPRSWCPRRCAGTCCYFASCCWPSPCGTTSSWVDPMDQESRCQALLPGNRGATWRALLLSGDSSRRPYQRTTLRAQADVTEAHQPHKMCQRGLPRERRQVDGLLDAEPTLQTGEQKCLFGRETAGFACTLAHDQGARHPTQPSLEYAPEQAGVARDHLSDHLVF